MKIKRRTLYLSMIALPILLMVAAMRPQINEEEKEAILIHTIMRSLEYMHFEPKEIDDEFSRTVYDQYTKQLFGSGRFATEEDLYRLSVYKKDIDDQSKKGSYEFFNLALETFNANLDKTQGYYRDILSKPFDFSITEKVEMDGDKRSLPKNDGELKEFWRKYLKYEALTRYVDAMEEQEKPVKVSDDDKAEEKEEKEVVEKKTPEELEKEAREDVLEMFDKWYVRMKKLEREDRLSHYLNVITSTFDPHTSYYKPIDKENFNIRFSGRLEGIGARLQTTDDYTKVSSIVVGGPAWKGKDLEENDVIMKVAQGEEEPVDIKGMQINDVVQLIRGDKGTEVRLTVKKDDGSIKTVIIIRDIVIMDAKFAKSLILDGSEKGQKVGYLYLPSFYADFQNEDGRFCAPDVRAELDKLKEAGVSGIILDLRNNGGGSLRDVVKMSGFFIEKGPIVQVKSRGKKPEILKDHNQKVQYDGQLIVMVNSFSASASEILAAALQDYNRAVIVGSNSTFGKGTVQRFVPLDRMNNIEKYNPLGDVKLTMQKFYRIDGRSTQKKGVVPDIILPDSYHYIATGEKDEKHPLAWDEIEPVKYSQDIIQIKHMDEIQARSVQRVESNPTFQKIVSNARRFEYQRNHTAYDLDIVTYKADKEKQDASAKKYKDMFGAEVVYGVRNLEVDLPSIHADESKEARNEDWVKSVTKDIYIQECLKIMNDLIDLN